MSSRTLGSETIDIAVLRAALTHHVNNVGEQLRELGLRTSYLKVYIAPSRFGDFGLQNKAAEVHFTNPTNQTATILKEANKLLNDIYVAGVPYKKVGILTANLAPNYFDQLDLFTNGQEDKMDGLQSEIDKINQTALGGKVQVGMVNRSRDWKPRSELRSPAYTTKWTDLATVKT